MSWRQRSDDVDEFVVVDVCELADEPTDIAKQSAKPEPTKPGLAGSAGLVQAGGPLATNNGKRARSPTASSRPAAAANLSPSTKSPARKYCLTASFSRMSPFKTVKVGVVDSPNEMTKPPVRRNILASFQAIDATDTTPKTELPSYSTQPPTSLAVERRLKAPRKEKSLGNLCKRFLLTMGELAAGSQANDVHLESVAKHMKVEKRRIYDIVNVMEALEAMTKTNKSFYRWCGLAALPQLVDALQKEAMAAKFPDRIRQVGEAMCNFMDLSASTREDSLRRTPSNASPLLYTTVDSSFKDESTWSQGSVADVSADESATVSVGGQCGGKNSLVHLCRRFLMMLLCDPEKRYVSLDVLSTVLIKDPASEDFTPPDRSRCRRLYDIANVLEAMELIRKVPGHFGTKKIPLFEYCGPEPDASPLNAEQSMRRFLDRIGLSAMSAGGALHGAAPPPPSLPASTVSDTVLTRTARHFAAGAPPTAASPSIQYLAEVAAQFMRSRLQPFQSVAGSMKLVVDEDKENRPPALSPILVKSEPVLRPQPQNNDIDSPKPINPRTSLKSLPMFNDSSSPASTNASAASAAMSELLKSVLSPVSSAIVDPLNPIVPPSLRSRRSDSGTQLLATVQQTPRPKVTHSVSSILGAVQDRNHSNGGTGCVLSASPKAFKPYSQSFRNNNADNIPHNKNTTKTPLRQ